MNYKEYISLLDSPCLDVRLNALRSLKNLIENKWHTQTQVTTDADGKVTFKGFYGQYDVEIATADDIVHRTVSLRAKGKKDITIQL